MNQEHHLSRIWQKGGIKNCQAFGFHQRHQIRKNRNYKNLYVITIFVLKDPSIENFQITAFISFQDPTIYCPISQRPLKVKDLIDVKFTPVNDPDEKKSIHTRENRYMCAVTHDILSNSVPCAVLRPT